MKLNCSLVTVFNKVAQLFQGLVESVADSMREMELVCDGWGLDRYMGAVNEDDQLRKRLAKVIVAWQACKMVLEEPIEHQSKRYALLRIETDVTWGDLPEVLSLKFPEWKFGEYEDLSNFIGAEVYEDRVVAYCHNSDHFYYVDHKGREVKKDVRSLKNPPYVVGPFLLIESR